MSKALIVLFVLFSALSWSDFNFNESFDDEFKDYSLLAITSEFIEQGLFFPAFDEQLSFWHQIGNPGQLSDIEGFYNKYGKMIMDQLKVNYFHYTLRSIRDMEFLKSYFEKKFSTKKLNGASASHNYSDLFKVFSKYVEDKDLDSIKNFMEKHHFSKQEKALIVIVLMHTKQFNDQIVDFIKSLSLDINQTIKNQKFIYKKFPFLRQNVVITSLAHELIATGEPSLIEQAFEDKSFNVRARTFLEENFIHFFIRSNNMVNERTVPELQSQSINMILKKINLSSEEQTAPGINPLVSAPQSNNHPHLVNPALGERDSLGFNPLMLALQLNHTLFVNGILDFISKQQPSNVFDFRETMAKSRDNYDRDMIDIAVQNNNLELASQLMKVMGFLAEDIKNNLYIKQMENGRLGTINMLPYTRISPFFSYYIQEFLDFFKNQMFTVNELEDKEKIKQYQLLLKDMLKDVAYKIDLWEHQRQKTISNLLRNKKSFSIVSAIQKRSRKALTDLDESQQEMLSAFIFLGEKDRSEIEPVESFQKLTGNAQNLNYKGEKRTAVTHFLNEAIIYSSLPAVEYLLESYFDKNWFKAFIKNNVEIMNLELDPFSFFFTNRTELRWYRENKKLYETGVDLIIDPLSLALFTYASIPSENTQMKQSAQKIIRLLSNYQNPGMYSNTKISSSPMGWAIGLGLLEEVRFFKEEKQVEIPTNVNIQLDDHIIVLGSVYATEVNEFINLQDYLIPYLEEDPVSDCERTFLH